MRMFLRSGVIAIALIPGVPVWAADLPMRSVAPAPMIAPAPTWTGLYIGGNGGYSAGTSSNTSVTTFAGTSVVIDTATTDMSVTGALAGGQIGYNWQFDPSWVFGLEGDIDWADQSGKSIVSVPLTTTTVTEEAKLDWLATIRARLGYVTGSALWYVTGGWADGKRELNGTSTLGNPVAIAGSSSVSSTKSGWTVGGGVETKLWNSNWSAKLEYLHVDLGTQTATLTTTTVTAPIVPVSNRNVSAKMRDEIVRVGVNYKFW